MVQALVTIDGNTNRVLSIVKAQNGLKDKGEAIEYIVSFYIHEKAEPELKPEFIEKIRRTEHKKGIKFRSTAELRKRYR